MSSDEKTKVKKDHEHFVNDDPTEFPKEDMEDLAKKAVKKFEKTDKQPFLFKEFLNYEILKNRDLSPVIIDGKKMIQAHL